MLPILRVQLKYLTEYSISVVTVQMAPQQLLAVLHLKFSQREDGKTLISLRYFLRITKAVERLLQ